MKSYMPEMYAKSQTMNEVISTDAAELDDREAQIRDIFEQFFIDWATWGLAYWEDSFGLPRNPDLSYDERRSLIKAKKRSTGIVTVPMIKNVAESYNFGEVEVNQLFSDYAIEIKFVSKYGVPSNIDNIKNSLRTIIPAHLGINFIFSYLTWDEFDSYNFTWDQFDDLNLSWDELEVYQQ